MKKKLLALVAVLTLAVTSVFGLTACSGSDKTDWEYIKERGKIVVGVTDYPPLDIKNDKGIFDSGFDYELAKAVGKELGVEVEFKEITWSQKVMDLNSKKVDCLWNGMTVSDDLKENVAFSKPYMKNQQIIIVKADSQLNTIEDVKINVDKIGAEEGSAGDTYINDVFGKNKFQPIPSQMELFTQVTANKLDAAVLDAVFANYFINLEANRGKFKTIEVDSPAENFAIGFRKNDTEFVSKVNAAIETLKQNSTLKSLADKYGLADQIL